MEGERWEVVDISQKKRNMGIAMTSASIVCFTFALIWGFIAFQLAVYDWHSYAEFPEADQIFVNQNGYPSTWYPQRGVLSEENEIDEYYFEQENFEANIYINLNSEMNMEANKRACLLCTVDEIAFETYVNSSQCEVNYHSLIDGRRTVNIAIFLINIYNNDNNTIEIYDTIKYEINNNGELSYNSKKELDVEIEYEILIAIEDLAGASSTAVNAFILLNVIIFSVMIMFSVVLLYIGARKFYSYNRHAASSE